MATAAIAQDNQRFWLPMAGLLAIGLVVRLGIALISYGSRDAVSWATFADMVQTRGFFETWQTEPQMNHPPLPVAYAATAWKVVGAQMSERARFCVLLKLPSIVADLGTGALLGLIGRRRAGDRDDGRSATRFGLALAATFLLSPLAILTSGYHGNTDSVLTFFCLLAFAALDLQRVGRAGLALGAAVNVKLAPLILVLPALSMCRSRRDAVRFIAALSIGAIPFLPLLALAGRSFVHNAIGYELVEARWGLMYPALNIEGHNEQGAARVGLVAAYVAIGKATIWLATIALAGWQWRTRRFGALDVGAIAFGIVLIFAPGFGIQYLIWPLPFMIAAAPRASIGYHAIASVFAAGAYYWFLDPDRWPLFSTFNDMMPHEIAIIGVFAWAAIVVFVVNRIRNAAVAPIRAAST